jgi:hypothetical protein
MEVLPMNFGLKTRLKLLPISILAITVLSFTQAQAKNKKLQVAEVFQTAHTVYVESLDGDISKPGLSQADHQAILQVQEAVREWNRYTLAPSRDKADLIIVVRKGHSMGDQDHMGLATRPGASSSGIIPGARSSFPGRPVDRTDTGGTGADDMAEQDLVRVYTLNEKGKLKGPVWARGMDEGLSGPSVRLLMELKSAVEITYPRDAAPATQTASQPAP